MEPPAGRGSPSYPPSSSPPKRIRTRAFGNNNAYNAMSGTLWVTALAAVLAVLFILPVPSSASYEPADNDLVFDDDLSISSKHLTPPKVSLLHPSEVAMPDYQLDDPAVPLAKKRVCHTETVTVKPLTWFGKTTTKEVEVCEEVDVSVEETEDKKDEPTEGAVAAAISAAAGSSTTLRRHTRQTEPTYDDLDADTRVDDEDLDGSGDDLPEGSADETSSTIVPTIETSSAPVVFSGGQQFYRILINVNEPFRDEMKDRSSDAFKLIEQNITHAVDELYKSTPGRQSSTVIKIEKADDIFFSTVTLDLGTLGYNDSDALRQILEKQIRDYHSIGEIKVSSDGFVFRPIRAAQPSVQSCPEGQMPCSSSGCVDVAARCDGKNDCADGSDEKGCGDDQPESGTESTDSPSTDLPSPRLLTTPKPVDDWEDRDLDEGITTELPETTRRPPHAHSSPEESVETTTELDSGLVIPVPTQAPLDRCRADDKVRCEDGSAFICEDQSCDGKKDCADGSDEIGCAPPVTGCFPGEFACDTSRCIHETQVCDGEVQCSDGTDEMNCATTTPTPVTRPPPTQPTRGPVCDDDEFQCRDGRCLEENLRCDGTRDCLDGEDEDRCPTCSDSEFRCNDGRCIDLRYHCDGKNDCGDQSDEEGCGPLAPCPESDFSCNDGSCIPMSQHCDGFLNCPLGTDEIGCESCLADEFRCNDGSCIKKEFRCDAIPDCKDDEDEEDCDSVDSTCPPDGLSCDGRKCLQKSKKCDGIFDCIDGSDERDCGSCPPGDFLCPEGICLTGDKQCDGIADCRDASDERDCVRTCRPTEFRCNDGFCVDQGLRCNGYSECRDGSDELNCVDEKCNEDQFQCDNGVCIAASFRCDGFKDCVDGNDEANCTTTCRANEFLCPDLRTCVPEQKRCDRAIDCPDGSDELGCPPTVRCQSNELLCPDQRTCFPEYKLCDKVPDCPDRWDEANCPETCSSDEFTCRDGSCIDSRRRCDRRRDCRDGSDEFGCDCRSNEFRCASGDCIPLQYRCNRRYDCADGSDERNCQPTTTTPTPVRCGPREYLCRPSGTCLSISTRCDGRIDCPDYTDESNCAEPREGLNLKTYPPDQIIKEIGKDREVVFQCRDEGPLRARVKWSRGDGSPMPPGSRDLNGRLEMPNIQLSHTGTYICEAVGYPESTPGSRVSVYLKVEPSEQPPIRIPEACGMHEATCNNRECIPKSQVCDGTPDCSDGSDEMRCSPHGCEPNEFRCENKKCVLKTWRCDSDDDCGDGSDERGCVAVPGSPCRYNEHQCRSGGQCIPKSFHCDGETDCHDGSDEVGCSLAVIVIPPQPMLMVNVGETFVITCKAVGVPTPEIVWRLNWGHVPSKCSSTSIDGLGTLTCPRAEESDQGAYSCEAVNVRGGSIFAIPDCILQVKPIRDSCEVGFFKPDPVQQECLSCFCFGVTSDCSRANLYIHQLPPPINVYKLVGVRVEPGSRSRVEILPSLQSRFGQPVIQPLSSNGFSAYQSQPNERTLIENNVIPYFSMPETYHGNLLKSYGGYLKYRVMSDGQGKYLDAPDVILSGNGYTLIHPGRKIVSGRDQDINVRFFYGEWYKWIAARPGGDIPEQPDGELASREEIMMALANVDYLLIRAMYDNGNHLDTTISNIAMDTADTANAGLGIANYVEECRCPPAYHGLSCEKCAPGYQHVKSGSWLGSCVITESCEQGYYGDPGRGIACQVCPCPLTTPSNQFGRTCILDTDNQPTCRCPQGYVGRRCERCAEGYEGNPLVPGSSCRRVREQCNPIGSLNSYLDARGQCPCKENVYGAMCDQCKPNTFYLSAENTYGCLSCFCMGITNQCQSSPWYRDKISTTFSSSPLNFKLVRKGQGEITQNITEGIRVNSGTREITFSDFPRGSDGSEVHYWALPDQFLGDKVTSYGGYLTFTLRYVPAPGGQRSRNNAPIVEIISWNNLHLLYYGGETVEPDKLMTVRIPITERDWERLDSKPVDRANFLMALADVKAILIKAAYTTNTREAALQSVSLDIAVDRNTGLERAFAVEYCSCPRGYIGHSCEDCAPGYTRDDSGIYLGRCQPCQCNGHSDDCDPESGVCRNCRDNTWGERCQECRPGFTGDATNRNIGCTATSGSLCRCDPRGSAQPGCPAGDQCVCKPNVQGRYCEECRPGSFGLSENLALGCHECFCSGVTSQCQSSTEHYRIQIPMQIGVPGYEFMLTDSTRREVTITDGFTTDVSRNEIGYAFPAVGITGRSQRLFWSLPSSFTGNKVTSYGGKITLTQRYISRSGASEFSDTDVIITGGGITLYWKNPMETRPNQPFTYSVPLFESEWRHLDQSVPRPASRADLMTVLIKLEAILVRATFSTDTEYTYLSDVSMDSSVVGRYQPSSLATANDIEKCYCPPGYEGTSCESCAHGYYLDFNSRENGVFGTCRPCPCNNNEESCSLVREGNEYVVRCRCKPGFDESQFCAVESSPLQTERPTGAPPQRPPTISVSINEPTILIVEVGGSVRYRCSGRSLRAQIPVRISWSKEGGVLPPGRSQDDGQGVLVITDLRPSDSGAYLCEVTDGESVATERAVLTVGAPARGPSVTVYPSGHQIVPEGSPVEFRCEGTGSPMPTLQWSRVHGGQLNPTAVFRDGMFRIASVRKSDEAEYICTGRSPGGTASEKVVLYVRAPDTGSRPEPEPPVRIEPQAFEGNAGDTVRLSCSAAHDRRATVRWTRDGSEIPASAGLTDGGTTLTIYSATAADSGVYICATVTPSGETVQAQAVVNIISFRSPPTVRIEPDRQTIPQGTSAELRCLASGDPTPSIRWSKAAQELGSNVQIIGQLFRLNNAQVSDRGVYVCTAQNTGGTSQASAIIEVERRQAPSIELYPEARQVVPRGGSALVQCRITDGIPTPKLTWTRIDGNPFSPNVEELAGGVLRFNQVTGPETGQYQCRAENEAGSTSAIAYLEMQTLPVITLKYPGSLSDGGRHQYRVKPGQRVRMECTADGDPTPTVSWNRVHPGYPYSPGETKESAVFEITQAAPSDSGTYTCEARNVLGTSQERLQLIVDSEEDTNEVDRGNGYPSGRPTESGVLLNNEKFSVVEGGSVTMRCAVRDNRERIFLTWVRAGPALMPADNLVKDGVLHMNNVRRDAAGEYICQGIGQSGNTLFTASAFLEVTAPPRIKLNPVRQVARPGDNVYISCTATGDQPISITWVKQDGPLPRSVVVSGGSLHFRGIEVSDAGHYVCIARNPAGEADGVANIIVTERQQVVQATQQDVTTYAGSSVELKCSIMPGTRVTWARDGGQPLPRRYREREDPQNGVSILELGRVTEEDGGRYFCHAESDIGTSSDFVDLRVERERVNDIALHIDASQEIIRSGDTVDIRCDVSGDPNAAVSWSKAGEEFASNIQTRANLLRVNNVNQRNGGVYTCTAKTSGGVYKEDYVLTIQDTNEISPSETDGQRATTPYPKPIETRSAPYGSAVVMECHTDLDPPVTHVWSRQGGFLPKDAIVDRDILKIPIVQPSDAGIYVCTAMSDSEKMEILTVLVVKDVIPRFDQNPVSFMSLPPLPSAYLQFSIEISFKPESADGLILYNGQNPGGTGDFVSFGLSQGHPELRFDVGSGPAFIRAPQPVSLGKWHTVKLERNLRRGSMYVDGAGPYTGSTSGRFQGLDLEDPLYIGGVPDFSSIRSVAGFTQGFVGCISRFVVGNKEHNLVRDATSRDGVHSCDTCSSNDATHCHNDGICQEASTPNGFVCICPSGFSGDHCERVGEACFPGACHNGGTCMNGNGGLKCLCPMGKKGRRCEEDVVIRTPAFPADGGYIAYPTPKALKRLKLNLEVKPRQLSDGLLLYCAQSEDGVGDFTSLTLNDGRIEFRYDVGSGTAVLRSNKELELDRWVTIVAGRDGREGFLAVDGEETVSGKSPGSTRGLNLKTPLYIGGYNKEKVTIAPGVGLTADSHGHIAHFVGCVNEIEVSGVALDLIQSAVESANIVDCAEDGHVDGNLSGRSDGENGGHSSAAEHGNEIFPVTRGSKNPCESAPCHNDAICLPAAHDPNDYECHCSIGFRGRNCESSDSVCDSLKPCRNGGTCISSSPSVYHCACSLGYAGKNCDQRIDFSESVGFQGDGYLEMSADLLPHKSQNELESIIIEFSTTSSDGIIFWHGQEPETDGRSQDYISIAVVGGHLEFGYEMGSGPALITLSQTRVDDGKRHRAVFHREGKDGSIELDRNEVKIGESQGFLAMLNTAGNIYLGGVPNARLMTAGKHNDGFSGCIHSIEIQNSGPLNLRDKALSGVNAHPCSNYDEDEITEDYEENNVFEGLDRAL